uniref:Uncharacterized protein n=1 Tax=Rhizophora mucronata TaxID=61149 RepID=A0A2P2J1H7_RHIMU
MLSKLFYHETLVIGIIDNLMLKIFLMKCNFVNQLVHVYCNLLLYVT